MSEKSERTTLSGSMSSAGVFPVRTSATQGSKQASAGSGRVSGRSLPVSFARYDRASSSWRTLQRCLSGEWALYSETWPQAGTMRNGKCFERPALEHPTSGQGSVSLPTVTANESKGAGRKRYVGSPHFRGAKMSEGLRTCYGDPIYLNPSFVELAMGFPKEWTLLETP